MVILCAVGTLMAWMMMEQAPENMLSVGVLVDRWTDMLDLDSAKEYIREKIPVIRHIAEIMYRSFGPNG